MKADKQSILFNNSPLEALAQIVLNSANAPLVRIESATKNKPTLVHFTSTVDGDVPVCVLPVDELSRRSARLELAKCHVEEVS